MADYAADNRYGRCGSKGCTNHAARDGNGVAFVYCDPCQRQLNQGQTLDRILALLTNSIESGPLNLETVAMELNSVQQAALEAADARRDARGLAERSYASGVSGSSSGSISSPAPRVS